MSIRKVSLLVTLALIIPFGSAFAAGAGGITWGDQRAGAGLSNDVLSISEVGAFGYGVNRNGQRTGGFGYALYSPAGTSSVAGGVGGFILGQEGHAGPVTFAVNLWSGIGGLTSTYMGTDTPMGILFGEANVEVGIAITRWMQLSAYMGMQGIADIDVHEGIGTRLAAYSPVVGVRLAWGAFNAKW